MKIEPFHGALAPIIGFGLLAAACAGSAAGQTYGTSASKVTLAATSVKTSTATVGGQSEMILTDGKRRTLYLFTPEKDGMLACSGDCLKSWPALLLPKGMAVATSDPALPGKLGTVMRSDGTRQVTYNEWPLYTFVGDKKSGDITGEGVGDQWFVVQSMPADADNDADGTTAPARIAPSPPQAASAPTVTATARP